MTLSKNYDNTKNELKFKSLPATPVYPYIQRMPKNILGSIFQSTEKFLASSFGRGLTAVYATWGLYFLLLWPRLLFWKDGNIVSGWIGTWGDWAAHISYASPFAYRPPTNWFTAHPLIYGQKFSYHFMADAISGWLIKAGTDTVTAFIVPSIVTTLLLLLLLYTFYHQILHSARQSFLAVTIFLTSGGLGFWRFIADLLQKPSLETLMFPPQEYTHLAQFNIEMLNTVTGMLIPQRALLLGVPATLLLLIILRVWMRKNFNGVSLIKQISLGTAIGLLPIIHTHTYITLFILISVLFIFSLRNWRKWLTIGLAAAISSFLIYLYFYNGSIDESFLSLRPIWLAGNNPKYPGPLNFWWLNWGLFLPFALIGITTRKLYKNPLIVGGIITFIIGNLISFQPMIISNDRILLWSYLILSAPAASFLAFLWRQGKISAIVTMLLFTMITASGFIDLWRITNTDKLQITLLTKDSLSTAKKFRETIDSSSTILTSTAHDHWIRTHTGNQTLLGYTGWIYTYGFNYEDIHQDIIKMYQGKETTPKLLNKYNIDYVLIGPSELGEFGANENYYKQNYSAILKTDQNTVYQIK